MLKLWSAVSKVMDCNEVWPEPSAIWRRSYTFFLLATTYLLPLGLLTLTYGMVSRKLWLRTAPGNADETRDMNQLRSKRKVSSRRFTFTSWFMQIMQIISVSYLFNVWLVAASNDKAYNTYNSKWLWKRMLLIIKPKSLLAHNRPLI